MLTFEFLLSGGSSNTSTDNSLGGDPSNVPILNGLNNLFSPITKNSTIGIDYRCFYIENTSTDTNLLDSVVSFTVVGTANILIGATLQDEVQQIVLNGDIVGGTFALQYLTQSTSSIQWTPMLTTMATNIQNALNDLTYLSNVQVTAQRPSSTQFIYIITFAGDDGNKNYLPLSIVNNQMLGIGVNFSITTVVSGSPINAVAPSIGFPNQAPNGVTFVTTELTIGNLGPGDYFSLWLQRSITQNDIDSLASLSNIEQNGLTLSMSGTSFFVGV
jgi:hypothetical protein